MKSHLSQFIDGQITKTRNAITGREQSRDAFHSGTDETWAKVGAMHGKVLSKSERTAIAERESRIITKLNADLQALLEIHEILKDQTLNPI